MRRTILFFLSAFFLFGNVFGYAVHAIAMEMGMETEQEAVTILEDGTPEGCEGDQCCNSQTNCLYQDELKENSAFSFQSNEPLAFPAQNPIFSIWKSDALKKLTAPPILPVFPAEFLTEKQLK